MARRANPLSVTDSFRAFVLDQLGELGGIVAKGMFGGVGLYRDGVFFAIIAGDVLYLKADDRTRPAFEAAGAEPFKPYPDRAGTMQYYAVPVDVLESPSELAKWGREAVAVAMRAAAEKEKKKGRTRKARPLIPDP